MRYPNLRYGDPAALAYHAAGIPIPVLAKRLRRSERIVKDWLEYRKKMPWWVPEVIRLQNMEKAEQMRQMNMQPVRAKLGLVRADALLEFPAQDEKKPGITPAITALEWPELFG
jgi:hypothetical protein